MSTHINPVCDSNSRTGRTRTVRRSLSALEKCGACKVTQRPHRERRACGVRTSRLSPQRESVWRACQSMRCANVFPRGGPSAFCIGSMVSAAPVTLQDGAGMPVVKSIGVLRLRLTRVPRTMPSAQMNQN